MVFKYVSTALLLFASVSPLNGLFPCIKGICKKPDIKKFVCTRDRIWTYNTSSTDFMMCKFDHMKTYRNMTMFFTRSFFVDDQWRRGIQNLEGRFSKQHKEVIQVSNKDHVVTSMEDLLYMSETHRCAVILVKQFIPNQQKFYDLRVWDTYLKTRPHEKCIKRFEKLKQRGRGIYMPKCKIILRIK
uniref:Putative group i salivary lipocalin n=1 Tax=Rhipicephalus pulchellus TaxID=72859 RepID=L7LQZ2_RHIPC